jgi:hypothetical protein
MIIAHLAYILYIAIAIIATVLSPFYSDIFQASDLMAKHHSAKLFIVLLERLSITWLFIMVISFFYFVIFTHKFCGPLVNIGHTITRITDRDFTRKVYLRKGDFLKKEANRINEMMKSLSDSIAIIKKENNLLLEDIAESMEAYGKQTEIDARLRGFHERADRCRMQLKHFQLIGESMNNTGTGQLQRQHLVGEKSPTADICA